MAETRREDAQRVEETWRYRAFAFHRGPVEIPELPFRARTRSDDALRVEFGNALTLAGHDDWVVPNVGWVKAYEWTEEGDWYKIELSEILITPEGKAMPFMPLLLLDD